LSKKEPLKITTGLRTERANEKRNVLQKRLFISVTAFVLLITAALIVLPRLHFKPAAVSGNIQTSKPTNPAPMEAAPALGPKTAPVTIIEYADFGCPSCWYWYRSGILIQLRAKYGDQIRFVWRDYPVITLLSPDAAEAGQCANEQGKFWEFHDTVYAHQGAIGASNLQAYAAAIGLNMDQFNECVSSHRYRDRVNAEQTEAFTHGYNGAPFFLVNNQLLLGGQSLSVFASIIDPLLAAGK
jgi:protein-disulfide isomerase